MFTKELIEVLWGKSYQEDEKSYWLPVWIHLLDAYQASQLIYDWIPNNVVRILKNDLNVTSEELKKIIGWFALTHDLGKISPGFYSRKFVVDHTKNLYYRMLTTSTINGTKLSFDFNRENYPKPRHEAVTSVVLEEMLLPLTKSKKEKRNLRKIFTVSSGHHGTPNSKEYKDAKNLETSLGKENYSVWKKAQQETYQFVNSIVFPLNDVEKIILRIISKDITSRSIVLLTSVLIMSDWLASDSSKFPLFPESIVLDLDDKDGITERLGLYNDYTALGINEKFIPNPIDDTFKLDSMMNNRFGFDGNILQNQVLKMLNDTYQNKGEDGLRNCFIIEAPMGLGKTEAALIGSEYINSITKQSGIFFGLPTMATSNAIYSRLGSYLISYENDNPESFFSERLMHSKANQVKSLTSQKTKTSASDKTKEYDNDYGLVPENFFEYGKHFKLMNNFVVGTVDQFLAFSLRLKYEYWKHLGMISKTVIIDEVHSLDGFMLGFLKRSLEWAGHYGIPVIITTATLNEDVKQELLNAYRKGKMTNDYS